MYRIFVVLIVFASLDLRAEAQPPSGSVLTFSEECNGDSLDLSKWVVDKTSPENAVHGDAGLLSTRQPENIVVSGGICRLVALKQERVSGFPWTTASMSTKDFHQQYGYFEARIRCNRASGLNNAFWLDAAKLGAVHYEIDIDEGHYPNQINMTVHNWTHSHTQTGSRVMAKEDLSLDFHVYGLLWTPQRLTWFLDNRPIFSQDAVDVAGQLKIIVSTAVLPWAGPIGPSLDGTAMEVDWIHAYKLLPQ